ncbi:MAG: ABC transporter substrate-binding protein [Patescibacteria group bacterium]
MWKKFFSTLRSYTTGERIVSIALAFVFLYSGTYLVFFAPSVTDSDTYYEGVVGYVSDLNPLFVDLNDVDRDISRLLFSGLTKYDPEKKMVVEDMATVKIDQTQKIYTFTLKEGLKWHDSEPVTADDVVFTFANVIQSPDFLNPVLKANFENVDIEKIDSKTVKFTLQKPLSFFLTNCTVGLLPAHIFKGLPVSEIQSSSLNQKPVGTGPYKIHDSYKIGLDEQGSLRLSRFEDYYGGTPALPYIVFQTYPSVQSLLDHADLLNGIVRLTGEEVDQFSLDRQKYSFTPYQLPQYTAVFFNMDRSNLKEKNVRLALEKAISKEDLLKLIPYRVAVDTPFLELKQEEWIYKPSMVQAQGALFGSGWKFPEKDDSTKISSLDLSTPVFRKNKKGETLQFELLAPQFPANLRKDLETEKTANFLRDAWQKIGIKIQVTRLPMQDFADRVQKRDYDLLLAGQSLGYNFDTYSFWHSTQSTDVGLNFSNYKSFPADALIEDVRVTFDSDRKTKSLQKLAKIIGDDIPAFFLFRDVYFYVSDKSVSELQLQNMAFPADRFANVVAWKKK